MEEHEDDYKGQRYLPGGVRGRHRRLWFLSETLDVEFNKMDERIKSTSNSGLVGCAVRSRETEIIFDPYNDPRCNANLDLDCGGLGMYMVPALSPITGRVVAVVQIAKPSKFMGINLAEMTPEQTKADNDVLWMVKECAKQVSGGNGLAQFRELASHLYHNLPAR